MTELRVLVPDELADMVANEARERGVTQDEVVVEAIREHVPRSPGGPLSFIGLGRAKPGFSTRLAEERMEAEGFS